MAFAIILFELFRIYRQTYFIVALTIAMTFAVILFQLSKIYRWTWSVGNTIFNYLKKNILKNKYNEQK
jgi:hypothetical protein